MALPTPAQNELHRVVVTGIIWKQRGEEREYLITKRALHKIWPGKWTVPGGGLEVSDYINTEPSYANPESP